MKAALKEYTKGKAEINQWTPETTKDKLEVIGKKYGEYVNALLSFAFFTIYRDVSEIIHNSYYGVRIFTGMQQKDITAFKTSEEAAAYFTQYQEKLATLILQQVNISIVAIIKILSQEFQLDTIKDIYQQSNDALARYANNATLKNDTNG